MYTTHRRSWREFRSDQRGITGLETAIVLIAFVVVASVFAFAVLSTGLFSSDQAKDTINAGLKEAQGTLSLQGGVTATTTITSGATQSGDANGVTTAFTLTNGPVIPGTLSIVYNATTFTEAASGANTYTVDDYNANQPIVTFNAAPADIGAAVNEITFTYSYYSVDTVTITVKNSAGGRAQDLDPGATILNYSDADNRAVLDGAGEFTVTFVGTNDGDSMLEEGELAQIAVPVSTYNLHRNKSFTVEIKPTSGAVLSVSRTLPSSVTASIQLN